jgi:hypothetical protein
VFLVLSVRPTNQANRRALCTSVFSALLGQHVLLQEHGTFLELAVRNSKAVRTAKLTGPRSQPLVR